MPGVKSWIFGKPLLSVPLVAAALCLSAAGLVFWRATQATHVARIESAASSLIPFTAAAVAASDPGDVEPIATPAAFRDIAAFRDRVYVSASSALTAYDANGNVVTRYRVGRELPATELGGMSAGSGELYIATHGAGVLAFNGQRFLRITTQDHARANATAVLALATGRVLIGTERGLLVYAGGTITSFAPQLEGAYITALAGGEGDLWIGTLGDGLFHHHAGQLDAFKEALPDPQVLSLAVVNQTAYAGTPLGVVEFRAGRPNRTLAAGYFATGLAADGGCLTVGTEDEGIAGVPLQPRGCVAQTQRMDTAIRQIAEIGGVRFAVTDRAIYRLEPGSKWTRVIEAGHAAFTDRNISALAVDKSGRLWAGYFDRGLDILEPDFEHVAHVEDDHLFCINRIAFSPAGDRTAVATANGLALFDSAQRLRQVLGRKDGLLADHVTDVVFRGGEMIVATPAGLSFVDASGIRSLYALQGLVNNHVYALAAAGPRLLAGTLGGISSVENDTVRVNYDATNSGLKHNWITALVADGGDWFAGTYGAGVFRLQAATGRWQPVTDAKEGFIVNPNAMLAAPDRIYAGTLGRGLLVVDRGSGRWSVITSGLPSLNVTALAASHGFLYVGTDNGLVRFRAAQD